MAVELADPSALTLEQLSDAAWRAGNLRHLLHSHQREAYDHHMAWEAKPIERPAKGEKLGAARWYVDDWGRRVGKTYKNGVILLQNGIRRPNSRMIYATKTEVQMKEILIPTIEAICTEAPDDVRPKFFTGRYGMRAGFHFPSSNSVLKIVGLDKDPDGLRGPYLDWCAISEAAFIRNLAKVVVSIIGPQFMRRPHARGYLESSAPEDTEHDFDTLFVADAKRRNAYWFFTYADIEDEELRTEAELEYEQAAEVDKVSADREYKGIRSRDFASVVFPEFDEKYVHDLPRPDHAYALGSFDPGFRHLFGALWAYLDHERGLLVLMDSWAGSNASTARVACVTAARELDLFGAPPPMSLDFIPIETTGKRLGWREYLRGDRCEDLADELHMLANLPADERPDYEQRPGRWVREDRPGQWTYYDNDMRHEYMANPHARVADVDHKLVADMRETFGFDFVTTTKEDLRTMVSNARRWFSAGRIVFLPSCGPVIDHVRAAKWAPHVGRTRFDEHKTLGHYDLAACLIYLCRYAEYIENRDPAPPQGIARAAVSPGDFLVDRLPWQEPKPYEVEVNRRIEAAEEELRMRYGLGEQRLREPPRMKR